MSFSNLTLDLRSYNPESNSHHHDYHQLVLPVKGALEINLANNQGKVTSDKAVLVTAGKEHGFSGSEENCFVVANIPTCLAPELKRLPATFAATNSLKINPNASELVLPIAVSLFKFASPLARTTGTYLACLSLA